MIKQTGITGDTGETIFADVHLLDMVIRDIKNDFTYAKERLNEGDIETLQKVVRSYIETLEDLYRRL